jgi:hypothetical protein
MRLVHLSAFSIAAVLVGCGNRERLVVPSAPHGGTLAGLPDGLGTLEIVRQDLPGATSQTQLVLYFLGPDGRPLTPAPRSATLKPRERGARPIDFRASDAADPSKAAALQSPPLGGRGDVTGELSATLGGKPVNLSISVR